MDVRPENKQHNLHTSSVYSAVQSRVQNCTPLGYYTTSSDAQQPRRVQFSSPLQQKPEIMPSKELTTPSSIPHQTVHICTCVQTNTNTHAHHVNPYQSLMVLTSFKLAGTKCTIYSNIRILCSGRK